MTTIAAAKTFTASSNDPDGVTRLWALKVHPETINELRWFYQSGPAALGYKSAFGSMIARIGCRPNKTTAGEPMVDNGETDRANALRAFVAPQDRDEDGEDPEDKMIRRLDDASKFRRIYAGLAALDRTQGASLEAIYENRAWPNALLQTFGELAGLAVISAAAIDAYEHATDTHARGIRWWLNERCRHGQGDRDDLVADVRKEIEALALDAHQAYSANRVASHGR